MSQKKLYFVYGTLKSGFGNNSLLGGAELIGPAITVEPFAMVCVGFPYLFNSPTHEARQVVGELYAVEDTKTEQRLDWLEGVECNHYIKETIQVVCDGQVYEAYVYIASNDTVEEILGIDVNPIHIKEGFYEWSRL